LEGLISNLEEACGNKVEFAVALIKKIDPPTGWLGSFQDVEWQASVFARALHDKWGVGDAVPYDAEGLSETVNGLQIALDLL
ncbi:MAG: hypothetical protein VW779_02885, partial [Halieaceae bacterium]